MKALVSDLWTRVLAGTVSLLVLWALFVVPAGQRWAGTLWLAAVGLMAAMAAVMLMAMRAAPHMRQALDTVLLDPVPASAVRKSANTLV